MRIVALDATVDDARTERAIAVALARAPERLFLFRAAAACASRMIAKDIARHDDRFFDLAASWLLDGDASRTAPPTRASVSIPLLEVGVAVVVHAASAAPMQATSRAVELMGPKVCMAIPAFLDRDEVENASLWIVGGEDSFALEQTRGRAIVWPGDAIAAGGTIAVLDATGPVQEVKVSRVDLDGQIVDEVESTVTGNLSRMQVQG